MGKRGISKGGLFAALLLLTQTVLGQMYQYRQIGSADGLSYNYVTSMSLDRYNRLWVGTSNGVNIISNGSVISYTRARDLSGESEPIGRVVDIACCPAGILVAGGSSLYWFDESGETFSRLVWDGMDIMAAALVKHGENVLIFESRLNALLKLNASTGELSMLRSFPEAELSGIRKMAAPSRKRNLLLMISGTRGVFEYDMEREVLTHVDAIPDQIRTSSVYLDAHDNLWLSSANSGVACYDIEDRYAIRHSFTKEDTPLTDNDILCIAESGDCLYFGTDGGGINVIDRKDGWKDVIRTPILQSVTTLGTDAEGHLLAGTTHYGVIGIRENFIRTLQDTYMQNSGSGLSNSTVLSMYEDPDRGIWIGTDGGGLNLYDETTGNVTQFPSTFGRKVNSICPYGSDGLLLMLYNEGIFLFNKRTEILTSFDIKGMPRLDFSSGRSNFLKMVPLENKDILFINGEEDNWLFRNKTKDVISFPSAMSPQGVPEMLSNFHCGKDYTLALGRSGIYEINNNSLTINNLYQGGGRITSVCYAEDGTCWFTDSEGVASWHPVTGQVSRLRLPGDVAGGCSSVTVDRKGNLWITVDGGVLVNYDVPGRIFRYYSSDDGMEELWCNGRRGTLTSSRGNIFIPGSSGLVIISPDKARVSLREDSSLQVSLLSVTVDDVPEAMETGRVIKVPNHFGSIKVRISTDRPDPLVPHRYRYRLEGRNHEPMVLSGDEEYMIQNHAPGFYTLLVSTLTRTGWSEMVPVVSIRVIPPLWLRPYMWVLYAVLAVAAVCCLYLWRARKARIRAAQEWQMQEKKQVEDQILFMTNVSHELRTPLTLIYNPVKRLIERERLPDPVRNTLVQISRQVLRITQMVDMVLDVHKMDVTGSSLFIEPVALNQWIRQFALEFRMELEEKGLALSFDLDDTIGDVYLDRTKIEAALSNLVMNSIKYSDSGTITIRTSIPDAGHVRVAVSDEGRGFSGDPERLFQRFYQKDNSDIGYGIGLSYTKLLVEKHGGTVGARPNDVVGSTFWFDLPRDLKAEDFLAEYRLPSAPSPSMDLDDDMSEDGFRTDTQTLLVVDNQESILRYIRSEYQSLFKHVYTATNGQEALEIIKIKLPSVVVSDVVMPVMNGFELCKAVKSDISISHIPVILLTARDDMQNQMTGYKLGADCYVPKPFDIRMLYYIIRTQLRNRSEVKRQYATAAFQNSTRELTFSLADEKFILKLNKFVLGNLSDPELDIDKVADHMCISRSTLFYKMNDLTGMSMGRYIRKLRISRAKEMLEKTDESVNDISIRLGFSESRYFSTVFKQETGETPSQYKKRVRVEHRDA